HVPQYLDPRRGLVDVLASGAARPRGAELELLTRDSEAHRVRRYLSAPHAVTALASIPILGELSTADETSARFLGSRPGALRRRSEGVVSGRYPGGDRRADAAPGFPDPDRRLGRGHQRCAPGGGSGTPSARGRTP